MSNLDYIANGYLPADRRKQPRVHVNQALSFEYYASDGQKLGGGFGTTVNINNEGMMFETSIVLEPHMTVLVELIGPLHTFMATGNVAHIRQVSEAVFQVGVTFHQLIQGGWDLVIEPLHRTSED
jgi:hypothetical protein